MAGKTWHMSARVGGGASVESFQAGLSGRTDKDKSAIWIVDFKIINLVVPV
jgi:hypothetical protein